MLTKEVLVGNIHEHYDNSYAELVQLACNFSSEIHLQTGSVKVNAKSIMGIIAFDTATVAFYGTTGIFHTEICKVTAFRQILTFNAYSDSCQSGSI